MFEEKKWTNFEEFDFFFENFCSRAEVLNQEQTNLLIDLTKDFLWITQNSYFAHLKRAFFQILEFQNLNLEKVYVVPMLSKSDREKNKTKSSKLVAYSFRNTLLRYHEKFKDTNFIIVDELQHLPNKKKLESNKHPILIVDDFIGTGDTAIEALDEILEMRNYSNENLFILTLVAQEEGIKVIEEKGFKVFVDIRRKKGISDNYDAQEKMTLKGTMESIEEIFEQDEKFDIKYKFGYKRSESLVSMIRTPNNTFPLYWYNARLINGKKWNAPFPRH